MCLLRGTSLIFVWIAGSVVLNAGLLPQRPGFCIWSVYMRFVVDRVALDKGFSASTLVFLCQYHSIDAPYSSSSTRFSYQEDKRAKPGTLTKSNAYSDVGDNWIEKYFCVVK